CLAIQLRSYGRLDRTASLGGPAFSGVNDREKSDAVSVFYLRYLKIPLIPTTPRIKTPRRKSAEEGRLILFAVSFILGKSGLLQQLNQPYCTLPRLTRIELGGRFHITNLNRIHQVI